MKSNLTLLFRSSVVSSYIFRVPVFIALVLIAMILPFRASTFSAPHTIESRPSSQHLATQTYGKLPLSFEVNEGQIDSEVKFFSRGAGFRLFLGKTEATLELKSEKLVKGPIRRGETPTLHSAVLQMKISGTNPTAHVEGIEPLKGKLNYFIGKDPKGWRTNVSTYGKVLYRQIYTGIDLVYYGHRQQIEYDFKISPRANPRVIALQFLGADSFEVDNHGDLVFQTPEGEVRQSKPNIYQERAGCKSKIDGGYVIKKNKQIGFKIGRYDRHRALIIDPILVYSYSTYLGGNSDDSTGGISVDSSGCAYVVGTTRSPNFPSTPGAFQPLYSFFDVFVTKLSADGSALVYSTFVGGQNADFASGIAIDSFNNSYITGATNSIDFPTTLGVFQTSNRGYTDSFVAKIDSSGSSLIYSTYLGGSLYEQTSGATIAVDYSGAAFVTGWTQSTDFPTTPGAFQTVGSGGNPDDAYVSKLNPSGTSLVYSTFIRSAMGHGIAIDGFGNAYITGLATPPDFPTTAGAFRTTVAGSGGIFVTKVNPLGAGLLYSTYLFSPGPCNASFVRPSIAIDQASNAYIAGSTCPGDFQTTPGALQSIFGGGGNDGYVTKLNAAGSALVYSTYLGGSSTDDIQAIIVDGFGNAIVTGSTASGDFPTNNPIQPILRGKDVFVSKLNSNGAGLEYSTYFGGNESVSAGDEGLGVAMDSFGSVYITGVTYSTNFPVTVNGFQQTHSGSNIFEFADGFITKLSVFSNLSVQPNVGGNTGTTSVIIYGSSIKLGATVRLKQSGQPDIVGEGVAVSTNGLTMNASFDLRGKAGGLWDVVLTNPDGSSSLLAGGFNIQTGVQAQLWINLSGRTSLAAGRGAVYRINIGNRGNQDIHDVIAWIAVPDGVSVRADLPTLESVGGQSDDPVSRDGFVYTWVYVDNLKGGESKGFDLSLNTCCIGLGQIEVRAGLFEGTTLLQSLSQQPVSQKPRTFSVQPNQKLITTHQAIKGPFTDPPPPLVEGQIVFKYSDSNEFPKTGHVGIFVKENGIGKVVDFTTTRNPFFRGEYRLTPTSDWAPGTYVGAYLPPGISPQTAKLAADEALRVYYSKCSPKGCQSTPYAVPPILGYKDCVSAVSEFYRSVGYNPAWPDWWGPGSVFPLVSGTSWFEDRPWLYLNVLTTLIDPAHWSAIQLTRKISTQLSVVSSHDPNDKAGPTGFGPEHYTTDIQPLEYVIYFENQQSATAPAQEVIITDNLDPLNLDLSSLRFGPITFGKHQVLSPQGSPQFATNVDLRPELNLIVRISAAVDQNTGSLVCRFVSLDPSTQQLPKDPLLGFLPPNTNPPDGEGRVVFSVLPRRGLAAGTHIRNRATIIFDTNAPIDTPAWSNTIDNLKPQSEVLLQSAPSCTSINVQWLGTDLDSGILSYDIFVSENGGPYNLWLSTSETQAAFQGIAGGTYAFYSVARDNSGNIEDVPSAPDLTLTLPTNTSLNPTSQFFSMDGGSGNINVTVPNGCGWSAKSNADWIILNPPNVAGGGAVVSYWVLENSTRSARLGTLDVAGQRFTLVQDGGVGGNCDYWLSPTPTTYPSNGGTGTINISASVRCAWQAASSASWLTITSVNVGVGSGTVSYSVAPNPSTSGRKGIITIEGRSFFVKQKGNL